MKTEKMNKTDHIKKEEINKQKKQKKPQKKQTSPGMSHLPANGKQFLFLIRRPPCYSYIQVL